MTLPLKCTEMGSGVRLVLGLLEPFLAHICEAGGDRRKGRHQYLLWPGEGAKGSCVVTKCTCDHKAQHQEHASLWSPEDPGRGQAKASPTCPRDSSTQVPSRL